MFTMQRQFEAEITRLSVFWTAVEVLLWIAFFWVLYAVVKAAVRDGINEAQQATSWRRSVANARQTPKDAPDMRADR